MTDVEIEPHLVSDLGLWAVAGDHAGVFIQRVEPILYGALDGVLIAAPEAGPPDAPANQCVSGD
jgi:hypothetical protein